MIGMSVIFKYFIWILMNETLHFSKFLGKKSNKVLFSGDLKNSSPAFKISERGFLQMDHLDDSYAVQSVLEIGELRRVK